MKRNLLERIRFYLKGNRIIVPETIYIEVEYDNIGDAYVILKFVDKDDIKFNIVLHEEDMKGFIEEFKHEAPDMFS